MNAIEMSHVTKAYKDFTLKDITLELPTGCILGLVGENGAGKSTTIGLIMDAIAKDSGSIKVLGTDTESKDFIKVKEEVGVVLDEAYFPEVLSALEVNKIMRNTYKNWDEEYFKSLMKRFSLPDRKKFKDYSRGMKMKLAIAVAVSHHPKLLILDEATSGLDPMVREQILDIFNDFTREENHSVFISSHIISDLEKICDYIAFLHKGELILWEEKDRIKEIYAKVTISRKEFEKIPKEAVAGIRDGSYGVEVLVKREHMPKNSEMEIATLEEIILFLVKGGNEI